MLYEILKHIRNFFPVPGGQKSGEFKIENGTIETDFLKDGQYFLIEGSVLNDGVFVYPPTDLNDEEFYGTITGLAIPKAFLAVVDEIEAFEQKNSAGPYQSESFGGYSYTKATNAAGNVAGWQDVYRSRLNAWRKI